MNNKRNVRMSWSINDKSIDWLNERNNTTPNDASESLIPNDNWSTEWINNSTHHQTMQTFEWAPSDNWLIDCTIETINKWQMIDWMNKRNAKDDSNALHQCNDATAAQSNDSWIYWINHWIMEWFRVVNDSRWVNAAFIEWFIDDSLIDSLIDWCNWLIWFIDSSVIFRSTFVTVHVTIIIIIIISFIWLIDWLIDSLITKNQTNE